MISGTKRTRISKRLATDQRDIEDAGWFSARNGGRGFAKVLADARTAMAVELA
jgi:hypothetical protein